MTTIVKLQVASRAGKDSVQLKHVTANNLYTSVIVAMF